jgi:hypothetical protein
VSAVAWLVGAALLGGLPTQVYRDPGKVGKAATADCTLRARVVIVNLPNREDGPVLRHAWEAVRAGQPETLHIDREDAEAHRRASLRGIPKVPGKDLDEYPPAMARTRPLLVWHGSPRGAWQKKHRCPKPGV